MRILPAIDLMNGRAVQLEGGDPSKLKYEADPFEKAKEFSIAEALWIVDLDATLGIGSNLETIKQLVQQYPCFVGGGIRTKELADEILQAGAEKICIGTRALEEPSFLEQFDPEKVIVALDFKDGKLQKKGWTEEAKLPELSAKYYLITNVSVEGKEQGPDFEFIQNIISKYPNAIISGGVSSKEDVLKIKNMGAYAVVIGSALYSGKIKLEEVLKMKKIMPCLDTLNGKLVKGVKFEINKEFGDPAEYAKKYCEQGADEIAVLDINATPEGRETLLSVVRNVSAVCTVPLTVGGGMRSVEDIEKVLQAGADKVSINTAAVKNPNLIREAAEKFGSEKIVVAIDFTKQGDSWKVLTNAGKNLVDKDAIEWAKEVEQLGAGAILPTSLDADGTKSGFDLEATRLIKETVSVPIIASGGAGNLEDIYKVLTEGKADIALAASIFHYGTYTVQQVKDYLKEKGVEVL